MSTKASGYAKKKNDDYPTPVEAVQVLFTSANPFRIGTSAWDPACGKRERILEALRKNGRKARGSDIVFKQDFLRAVDPSQMDIITNPPFGIQGRLALTFIRKSLELTARYNRRVFFLLPIDFDSGGTRADVFDKCGRFAHKIVLTNRVRIFNGKSGTTNHAWFIWDGKTVKGRRPTISYAKINYNE